MSGSLRRMGMSLFALALVMTGSRLAGADGNAQVVFEDNFDKVDVAWGDPNDQGVIKDGKFTLRPISNRTYHVTYQGIVVDDGTVSAKLKIVKDSGDGQPCGLLFWGNDDSNYYTVCITQNGYFEVLRLVNNRWLYPVSMRKSDAVKKGYGQANEIRAVLKGNMASIQINGTDVASVKGQPPQGGSLFGLFAQSGAKDQTVVEYSQVRVTKP